MQLRKLFTDMEYIFLNGSLDLEIEDIIYDSRKVIKNSLFVCLSGTVYDGHKFAQDAVNKGAVALIVERDIPDIHGITVIQVKNSRIALAQISAAFFGHPAKELKVIGITGTKGKTTTACMLREMLVKAGHKVGLIGTIETIIDDVSIPSPNTTPESYIVQNYFRQMVTCGCDFVVMEVSSQGLMMHRVDGFEFDYGIFTNIEPDHIGSNEHKDFEDYLFCKSLLFKKCKVGIVNIDDSHTPQILKESTCSVETFGVAHDSMICATDIKLISEDSLLGIEYNISGLMNFKVRLNIPGIFNVYNSLAAISVGRHFEIPIPVILDALLNVRVKGRIEMIPNLDNYILMLDYAHNAMSLESLLKTLKEYHPKRLVCLFGCGGNRSKQRRYEMGEISGNLSDLTVITSDNPRDEKPEDIINDIKSGIQKTTGNYIEIPDRKEAIRYCIEHAKNGDVIVLAGKGHEDYQEIKGVKYPMDERIIIQDILRTIPKY